MFLARPREPAEPEVDGRGRRLCPACGRYAGRGTLGPGTDYEYLCKCGQPLLLRAGTERATDRGE